MSATNRAHVEVILSADGSNLSRETKRASKEFDQLGNSAQTAALAIAGVAAGMAAAQIGQSVLAADKAVYELAGHLNIAKQEAQGFADIGLDVYASGVGESIGELSRTTAMMARQFEHLGNVSRETMTQGVADASRIAQMHEQDQLKVVDAAAAVSKRFNLSIAESMDFLAAGFQNNLDGADDFLDTVREYSVYFQDAGGTAAQFFSLMETGMLTGVQGTDKAADMFKEFTLRIIDGSTLTRDSMAMLGLDITQVTAQINAGEITVADTFEMVLERLQGVSDEAIQMQAGVGIFGTQMEDVTRSTMENMDLTKFSMQDLAGSMDSVRAAGESLEARFVRMGRTVTTSIGQSETVQAMAHALADVADGITYLAKNSAALEPLVRIIGAGGLLWAGSMVAPKIMAAASAATAGLTKTIAVQTGSVARAAKVEAQHTAARVADIKATQGQLLAQRALVSQQLLNVKTTRERNALLAQQAALNKSLTVAQTQLNGAIAANTAAQARANTAMKGGGVAADVASGKLGKLELASYSLMAAYAGWEIGSYLHDNYEIARVAGARFVEAGLIGFARMQQTGAIMAAEISKGFAYMELAFQMPMAAIRSIWAELLANLNNRFAAFIGNIGSIAAYIPGLGETASKLQNYSTQLRGASDAMLATAKANNQFTQAYQKRAAEIEDALHTELLVHENAIDEIRRISTERVDDIVAGVDKETKAAKKSAAATKTVTKTLTEIPPAAAAAGGAAAAAGNQISEAAQKIQDARKAVDEFWQSLNTDFETAGMTQAERQLYDFEKQLRATGDYTEELVQLELKRAASLQQTIANKEHLRELDKRSRDAVANLGEELKLLQMTTAEQARYNALKDVQPQHRDAAELLYDQKLAIEAQNQELERQQEIWNEIAGIGNEFITGMLDGTTSLKDGLKNIAGQFAGMAMQQRQQAAMVQMGFGGGGISNANPGAGGGVGGMNLSGMDLAGLGGQLIGGLEKLGMSKLTTSIQGLGDKITGLFGGSIGGIGALDALSFGSSLLAGDTTGMLSSGAGMLGTALGGPVGGMIGSLAGQMLGGMFGGGETRSGGAYRISQGEFGKNAFSKIQGPSGGDISLQATQEAMLQAVETTNELLEKLGSTSRVVDFTGANETSANGKGGWWAGGKLSTGETFGEQFEGQNVFEKRGSYNAEEAMQGFGQDLEQSIIQALQAAADSPAWVKTMLDGIDAESLSSAQVGALLANIEAMHGVILSLEGLGVSAEQVTQSMLDGAGGADALAAATAIYFDKFAETSHVGMDIFNQFNQQMHGAFTDLGVSMPQTKEEFTQLVKSLDLTSKSGQELFGSLMALSPTFADYLDKVEAADQKYADTFMTASEQQAARINEAQGQLETIFAELDRPIPDSKEAFRELADGLDRTTADGNAAFMAMMSVADAAMVVYDGMETTKSSFAILRDELDGLDDIIKSSDIAAALKEAVTTSDNRDEAGDKFVNSMFGKLSSGFNDIIFKSVADMMLQAIINPLMQETLSSTQIRLNTAAQEGAIEINAGDQASESIKDGADELRKAAGNTAEDVIDERQKNVDRVKQFIKDTTELLQDESIKEAFAELAPDIKELGGAMFDANQGFNDFFPAVDETTQKTKDNTRATKDQGKAQEELTKAREEEIASLGKFRDQMATLATGLEGTELKLYQLGDLFANTDFSGIDLSGTAEQIAAAFGGLDDGRIATIAEQTGITIGELQGYAADYIKIRRDEAKAIAKANEKAAADAAKEADAAAKAAAKLSEDFGSWQGTLAGHTSELTKHELAIQQIGKQYNIADLNAQLAGVAAADLASYLQSFSEEDLQATAEALGVTAKEFTQDSTKIIASIQGMSDAAAKGVEFTQGLRESITKMGLEGEALDLYNLEQAYADNLAKAEQHQVGTTEVHELYERQRLEIVERYAAERTKAEADATEAFQGFQQSVAKFYDGLSENGRTLQSVLDKYGLASEYQRLAGESAEAVARSIAVLSENELKTVADAWDVSVSELMDDALRAVGAIDGLSDATDDLTSHLDIGGQHIQGITERFAQASERLKSIQAFDRDSLSLASISGQSGSPLAQAAEADAQALAAAHHELNALTKKMKSASYYMFANSSPENAQRLLVAYQQAELAKYEQYMLHVEAGIAGAQVAHEARMAQLSAEQDVYQQQADAALERANNVAEFIAELSNTEPVFDTLEDEIRHHYELRIEQIDAERDAAVAAHEAEMSALQALQDEVGNFAATLQDDLGRLRERMGLGDSLSTRLANARAHFANAEGTPAQLAAGQRLRDVVLENLQHQLDMVQEREGLEQDMHKAFLKYQQESLAVAEKIRASNEALLLNDNLSNLTPEQMFAESQRQLEAIATRAEGGDLEAAKEYEKARAVMLEQARRQFAGGAEYDRIFEAELARANRITGALDANAAEQGAFDEGVFADEISKIQQAALLELEHLSERTEQMGDSVSDEIRESQAAALANQDYWEQEAASARGETVVQLQAIHASLVSQQAIAQAQANARTAQMTAFDGDAMRRAAQDAYAEEARQREGLAQGLLGSAQKQAGIRADINAAAERRQVYQAQQTYFKSYDVGTPKVDSDQLAWIHQEEMILDRSSARVLRDYGIEVRAGMGVDTSELVALLKQLLGSQQLIQQLLQAIAQGQTEQVSVIAQLLDEYHTDNLARARKYEVA